MAILSFRTSNYAQNVYMSGMQRLTTREGFTGVSRTPDDYYPEVEKLAAKRYYIDDIDRALANGWINEQEHAETMAYKTETDPQHKPVPAIAAGETPAALV